MRPSTVSLAPFIMIKETKHRQGGRQDPQTTTAMDSLRLSLRADYWVIDEQGQLEEPDRVAGLPGADATDSPYSLAVETPPCADCGDLRRELVDRLRSTVSAAHNRGCRLLALGIRPDLLVDGPRLPDGEPPPVATASTRVVFEPEPGAAADCYNTLVALDPAFVLINTTCRVDGDQRYACGRPSLIHGGPTGRYRTTEEAPPDAEPTEPTPEVPVSRSDRDPPGAASTDHQPVAWLDGGSRIEWRSLDAATPTLLVDLLADVTEILRAAAHRRLRVESFGNGFHGDRLVLPSTAWQAIYTEAAIREGLSSLLVRAYLERFGIETGWYRAAARSAAEPASTADIPALCRRRATDLEADIGVPPLA